MAREISEIQNIMLTEIRSTPELAELNSTSKTAIYRLMTYIVAVCIWTLEKLFDTHKKEIDTVIYEYKPGTARWYRNMALAFQMGFDLKQDDDQFDNAGASDTEIESSKIIKYCSIPEEGIESSRLIIKIAGEEGSELRKLTDKELMRFTDYIKKIRYAGVKFLIVNNPADKLLVKMEVFINPLVLATDGTNIRTAKKAVELALKSYLKNLPFDGELVVNDLIAQLRAVEGVENVNISNIQSSTYNNDTRRYEDYKSINIKNIPEAGYFELDNQSSIAYVV
ncbi:nucleotidyltransferase [Flavobacterium sp. TN-1]